jgi:NTP pyrophosphatase (non-canonical NTP hydrolase)
MMVQIWTDMACGEDSRRSKRERALRLVEEALEFAQSVDVGADDLRRVCEYVYSRPKGDPGQEIAGVYVTMLAAACAVDVNAEDELAREILRIQQPDVIERVRRRQIEKRAAFGGEL